MATLTIWHGLSTPIKAVGRHQVKLLDFAHRYPTWHSYSTDRDTLRAVNSLVKKGCLITNEFGQFKFVFPSN